MKNNQAIRKIGLSVIAAGLFLAGIGKGNYVLQRDRHMSVRYEETGLKEKAVKDYYDTLPKKMGAEPNITIWSQQKGEKAFNPTLEKTVPVTVVKIWGDMEMVFYNRLENGTYPSQYDGSGCAISKAAAWELFQSSQAVGNQLNLGAKEYVIRGIVDIPDNVILLQEENTAAYPYLELTYPAAGISAAKTKEFLTGHLGLPDYDVFVDGGFYAGLVRLCISLPFWILYFFCASKGIRLVRQEDKRWKKYGIMVAGSLLFVGAFCILVKCGIRFSDEFIPSRWSDFTFWSEKMKYAAEDFRALKSSARLYPDMKLLQHVQHSIFCCAGSGVCLIGGLWRHKLGRSIPSVEITNSRNRGGRTGTCY